MHTKPDRIKPKKEIMKTYIGTKQINAKPMTRQAYNDLRGWTVPVDENPDDEGYLVEYVDGGKANVEGFTGYGFGELMGEPRFRDAIFMRTVDNQLVSWTASQTDVLAEDWAIVE